MNSIENVWIVDDDKSIRWVLEKALSQSGIKTTTFDSGDAMMRELDVNQPDALVSDIRMPGTDGLGVLSHIQKQHPDVPVIIMTAHSDLDSAVNAYREGAFEYLPKPFDIDEAVALTKRALAHRREQQEHLLPEIKESSAQIIGEAPAMQEVFRAIGRLSHSNITVLINGESGTGKELVARALHEHSPRKDRPFIALNMAAIPNDLIESELFGHEKGAFTGANSQRQGRFEQANGGTLFLDEIGDMPLDTQTRLLRVLSDGSFFRVGGHTPVNVDVRIVTATHQDLQQRVNEGQFREDLFHRLNVIRIHLPRLAERREDIPQLARHFLTRAAQELEVEPKTLLDETASYMSTLEWRGNVRQLENTCRWLTVMAASRDILISDLPDELLQDEENPTSNQKSWQDCLQAWAANELNKGHTALLDTAVPEFEKIMINVALQHTSGRKQEAAQLLGWGRNTLTRKLKELDL